MGQTLARSIVDLTPRPARAYQDRNLDSYGNGNDNMEHQVGPGNDRLPTIGPAPDRLFRRPQDAFLHTVGQAVGPLRWLARCTWTLDLPPLSASLTLRERSALGM